MLTKHQGNRFVCLEVGKFSISFVGSIGSVYPTLATEIPVPMSERFFLCPSLMNSLYLGGGKGTFLSHGPFLETFLDARKDIEMPCNLSDRTTHKTRQVIENSVKY